jgi:MFS family permease
LYNLLLICLASAGWAFGFGAGTQIVSRWLKDHDASDELIGWNHSCHYLGLALASFAVPWLTRRLGTRASSTVGMLASGVSLAIFPWGGGMPGWFALRLFNGGMSALSLIPLEALLSRDAPPQQRTRDFGFYGVALTVGFAIGVWAGLDLYESGDFLAFLLGGAAPTLGGFALLRGLMAGQLPTKEPAARIPLQGSRRFLSFSTAWCQGFLEGGMLPFLAFYLESRGMSANVAGGLMGVAMVGVILFQVPVSWFADGCGRVPTLLGCYGIVAIGLAVMPYCPGTISLAVCLFAFGACSGAMYPLGLALLGEGLPESSLARVYSWYLAIECLGSLMGPPAMGRARDMFGQGAMFAVALAVVGLVLLAWAGMRRRATETPLSSAAVDQTKEREVARIDV